MVGLIAFIWIAMCAINLPILIFADVVLVTQLQKRCMFLSHMDPHNQTTYTIFVRVLVFVAPLAITLASYVGIFCRILHGEIKVIASIDLARNNNQNIKQQQQQQQQQ